MKLSPMVLQGLWEFKSPFLQLPFVTDDHLRLFMTKKRHIKNLQQFAQLPADESRHVLKHLTDGEYENVMRVLGNMPLIDFSIRCEGMCVLVCICCVCVQPVVRCQFWNDPQLSTTRTPMW